MRRIRVIVIALVLATMSTVFVSDPAVAVGETTTVTPNTDLVDGQVVAVTGSGWSPTTVLGVQQCAGPPNPTCLPAEHVTTDETGAFSTPYAVHLVVNGVDCRMTNRCFLGVATENFSAFTTTALTFHVDTLPDLILKRRSDGALFFNDTYATAPGPSAFHTVAPGGTWSYAVLVQNDGSATGDITVHGSSVAAPFTVQYFYGYYDVTAAVTSAGLLLPAMAPNELRPLAVRFSAAPTTPVSTAAEVSMTVTTPGAPLLTDTLRLRVVAVAGA